MEAINIANNIVRSDSNYGAHLQHLRQEVNEAYMQIQNALEVASETQRGQLEKYERDLQQIVQEVNEFQDLK